MRAEQPPLRFVCRVVVGQLRGDQPFQGEQPVEQTGLGSGLSGPPTRDRLGRRSGRLPVEHAQFWVACYVSPNDILVGGRKWMRSRLSWLYRLSDRGVSSDGVP